MRGLTVDASNAVAAEVVARAVAVSLEFDGAPVRLTNTTFDLVIDGDTYIAVGALGTIDTIEESADLSAAGVRLSLSGIPRDMINIALGTDTQNRKATIWEVPLDRATLEPVADPIIVFRGRMDVMAAQLSANGASVSLTLTNRLADWERPRVVLFSDDEQQRTHPGDRSFRYANTMADAEIVWPAGSWFRALQ